jgi:hypothetical protein
MDTTTDAPMHAKDRSLAMSVARAGASAETDVADEHVETVAAAAAQPGHSDFAVATAAAPSVEEPPEHMGEQPETQAVAVAAEAAAGVEPVGRLSAGVGSALLPPLPPHEAMYELALPPLPPLSSDLPLHSAFAPLAASSPSPLANEEDRA